MNPNLGEGLSQVFTDLYNEYWSNKLIPPLQFNVCYAMYFWNTFTTLRFQFSTWAIPANFVKTCLVNSRLNHNPTCPDVSTLHKGLVSYSWKVFAGIASYSLSPYLFRLHHFFIFSFVLSCFLAHYLFLRWSMQLRDRCKSRKFHFWAYT
jgi:hypothetical protein